jgi:hypothetical protein
MVDFDDGYGPIPESVREDARVATAEWVAHHRDNHRHLPAGTMSPPGWRCLDCDATSSSLEG